MLRAWDSTSKFTCVWQVCLVTGMSSIATNATVTGRERRKTSGIKKLTLSVLLSALFCAMVKGFPAGLGKHLRLSPPPKVAKCALNTSLRITPHPVAVLSPFSAKSQRMRFAFFIPRLLLRQILLFSHLVTRAFSPATRRPTHTGTFEWRMERRFEDSSRDTDLDGETVQSTFDFRDILLSVHLRIKTSFNLGKLFRRTAQSILPTLFNSTLQVLFYWEREKKRNGCHCVQEVRQAVVVPGKSLVCARFVWRNSSLLGSKNYFCWRVTENARKNHLKRRTKLNLKSFFSPRRS